MRLSPYRIFVSYTLRIRLVFIQNNALYTDIKRAELRIVSTKVDINKTNSKNIHGKQVITTVTRALYLKTIPFLKGPECTKLKEESGVFMERNTKLHI